MCRLGFKRLAAGTARLAAAALAHLLVVGIEEQLANRVLVELDIVLIIIPVFSYMLIQELPVYFHSRVGAGLQQCFDHGLHICRARVRQDCKNKRTITLIVYEIDGLGCLL